MTKKHGHVNKGYLGYKSYDSSALIVLAVVLAIVRQINRLRKDCQM